MTGAIERTHGPDVLRGVGSFGGVFSAKAIMAMDDPVLVASTDGVGTKVELAARRDGARRRRRHRQPLHRRRARAGRGRCSSSTTSPPSELDADLVAEVVTGMAEACEAAGCALLGGETAEMPGVYAPGAFDIAGTLIGVAERAALLPRDDVAAGDVLIGVASSGPHTNGYSFLRKLFQWLPLDSSPTASIARSARRCSNRTALPRRARPRDRQRVKALAHITGGGLPENLPRVLPDGIDAGSARVVAGPTAVPAGPRAGDGRRHPRAAPDAQHGHRHGRGVRPAGRRQVQASIPEETWVIGRLVRRHWDDRIHVRAATLTRPRSPPSPIAVTLVACSVHDDAAPVTSTPEATTPWTPPPLRRANSRP